MYNIDILAFHDQQIMIMVQKMKMKPAKARCERMAQSVQFWLEKLKGTGRVECLS